jgi:hypothetical protein
MPRLAALVGLLPALSFSLVACGNAGAPEQVADAFAEAYFQRMDQEKAKEYTALGASSMLDDELRDVAEIRKDGYSPGEAAAEVTIRRGEPSPREQRIRFPYEVRVKTGAAEHVTDADIELAQIQGSWKVVRVGLRPR